MKSLLIHDVESLELPSKKTVARFSVTITNDDDEPLLTIVGWLYDAWRKLQPPRAKTGWNYISVVKLYPDFIKKLKDHLENVPEIQKILQPLRKDIPALGWPGKDDGTY